MNKSALVAVVIPCLVLGGWVGRLSWLERSGTEVRLSVGGFDPRDLLAGHYLTYTVNYGKPVCSEDVAEETQTCVCLKKNKATKTHEAEWVGVCAERPKGCSVFIKGDCYYGRFDAHIQRYYFPETFQSALAVVPEKSAIRVVLRPSGDGMVTGFTVDGVDVLDYARARATEK